jgi:hypothetical protein
MTALAYFIVGGVTRKPYLFLKVREFFFGGRLIDWLIAVAVLALFLTVLSSSTCSEPGSRSGSWRCWRRSLSMRRSTGKSRPMEARRGGPPAAVHFAATSNSTTVSMTDSPQIEGRRGYSIRPRAGLKKASDRAHPDFFVDRARGLRRCPTA